MRAAAPDAVPTAYPLRRSARQLGLKKIVKDGEGLPREAFQHDTKQLRAGTETGARTQDAAAAPPRAVKRRSAPSTPSHQSKRFKTEDEAVPAPTRLSRMPSPIKPLDWPSEKSSVRQAKKLEALATYADKRSPFPAFSRPTAAECRIAHRILASLHGERERPASLVAPTARAGCGNSPSVLDALVRTILSQNTSDRNSSAAKRSMDVVYGRSDRWEDIVRGGLGKLQRAIQCGGLSVVKSKVIIRILEQVVEKHGVYSLDHLFQASDGDAMRELLSFHGVGPKTASCVLLFCLRRESFAVDTHVYRLTGLLGWRPPCATREEAQAHLDAVVPDEEKYPLHVLLISHGKQCAECRAGGKNLGACELRRAFRRERLKDETEEALKQEEAAAVKQEDSHPS